MQETTNCKKCGALVYVSDVPSKRSGFCWRCEVKRLNGELQDLHAECMGHIADKSRLAGEIEELKTESEKLRYTAFETCHRMQLIVLYYGQPEVQAAVDAWLEPDEDGGSDWFNPPPGVDENLEKLEHFKESLQKMFPELFPE